MSLPPHRYHPPQGPTHILYRDEWLLAVNKPPGLLSVPGKAVGAEDCLEARVQRLDPRARLVHRLDGDTSGVMIFGRSHAAQAALGRQFEQRHTEKRYVARIAGRMSGAGRISLPLIADWPRRPLQKVCTEVGKAAITDWHVLAQEPQATRIALRPLTGRSHQLRVHLAALGHPILGDRFYDGPPAARLMLHAQKLTIRHPANNAAISFEVPPPF